MLTESDVRARMALSPMVCRWCVHLDADYNAQGEFLQVCLKGHPMTEEWCVDQERSA